MGLVSYTLWPDNAEEIAVKYRKQYFTPERFVDKVNPLYALTVPSDFVDFFGTKVCNIFIVGIPFGWLRQGDEYVEDWPPPGYNTSKAKHILDYKKFAKYETHVYMDFNIVAKIEEEEPETNFRELMDQTKVWMQEMCSDLAEYGFAIHEDITGDVPPSHFDEIFDEFYASLDT